MVDRGLGDRFQLELKYVRGALPGGRLDWDNKPETYKQYPDALRLALPQPDTQDGPPLWQSIQHRRSVRRYQAAPLSMAELSQLIWAGQGITARHGQIQLRAAPSAGALYPVETYLAVHHVDGLGCGVYHYNVPLHALELLRSGDYRRSTAAAALDQQIAATAAVVFVWTGVFGRSKWKYKQRAYRYVYLDAGHIAQNVALAAVGMGLGSCQVAALYDDEANELVGVDGEDESVVYMTTVGRLAP